MILFLCARTHIYMYMTSLRAHVHAHVIYRATQLRNCAIPWPRTVSPMEPPGTLPEKRVRKRSKRLSETDNTNGDAELTRKRPRRGTESAVNEVEGKRRSSKDRTASSKVSVSVGHLVAAYTCLVPTAWCVAVGHSRVQCPNLLVLDV